VQREQLPSWFEENCRLRGCHAQSPLGGLWHAGGPHEVFAAEGLLVPRVLVIRRCRCPAHRCLVVDLQLGQLQRVLVATSSSSGIGVLALLA
jgi:hypothetical protein